jgi:hypothetical protein
MVRGRLRGSQNRTTQWSRLRRWRKRIRGTMTQYKLTILCDRVHNIHLHANILVILLT